LSKAESLLGRKSIAKVCFVFSCQLWMVSYLFLHITAS
jgi:hypothetical protein